MESLKTLVEMRSEDLTTGEEPPQIVNWSLTPGVRRSIVERTDSPRIWLEVALTSLGDKPEFSYKPSPGTDEISFQDASAGQQATALLKVLLKEDSGPLIIDQPEDDLDNATILEIAEELWEAKQHRQIIFSSHNANIVVNGDSELVVHCDYLEGEGRTKGQIANEGAIDVQEIRIAIQDVMEGGEKAFLLRQQKYGF
ncbi:MAG: AAA family ATPase [bacterium]|nr:AAA family ATPase [bacterium]